MRSRDDLERTIALAYHGRLTDGESDAEDCTTCRETMLPVTDAVVEFVDEWLTERAAESSLSHVHALRWRQRMGREDGA